jgi:hypothetical protein
VDGPLTPALSLREREPDHRRPSHRDPLLAPLSLKEREPINVVRYTAIRFCPLSLRERAGVRGPFTTDPGA